jgi:hypothetical protein
MVVDRQMQIFPAHPPSVALTGSVNRIGHRITCELAELLDVDMDDLAWSGALIAADRLGRLERRQPVEAEALKNAADGRRRIPDLGGDLLASTALPAQSLDRRAHARRRLARR